MFWTILYLLVGLLAGAAFLRFAAAGAEIARRRLSVGLVVAAFIYVAFAMAAFESTWLFIEIVGVGIFTGFYFLANRLSVRWLSLGWGLHVLWDVALHTILNPDFVPRWYPPVCISFNLLVAGYIWRKTEILDGF